jgi:uncharacterized membrane protein YjjP (DUF1212 family)
VNVHAISRHAFGSLAGFTAAAVTVAFFSGGWLDALLVFVVVALGVAVVVELLRNAWTEPDEPLPRRNR